MDKICGDSTVNKKIPEFAYTAPEEFIIGLLNGYISGKETIIKDNCIEISSYSKI